MKFTDDDLKRYISHAKSLGTNNEIHMPMLEFRALLSRLEAAEACIEFVGTCCDCLELKSDESGYKAWRESKGEL